MMASDPDIIQKQYYTIGEVAKELDVNESTIRYWETEFKQVNPKKNRKGNRVFTPKDIETLKKIHFLLKVKQYTIAGAREIFKTGGKNIEDELTLRQTFLKLRSFLLELKESL